MNYEEFNIEFPNGIKVCICVLEKIGGFYLGFSKDIIKEFEKSKKNYKVLVKNVLVFKLNKNLSEMSLELASKEKRTEVLVKSEKFQNLMYLYLKQKSKEN